MREGKSGLDEGSCAWTKYTKVDDYITVQNRSTKENRRGVEEIGGIDGTARCPDDGKANCSVSFFWFMRKKPTKRFYNYQVMDTDYTNYSIVYTCNTGLFGLYHSENAWIITRAQEPSSGDKTTWKN